MTEQLIAVTGPRAGVAYGYTFSDLAQRLLPAIILDAYPTKAVSAARAIEIAKSVAPTPLFQEKSA
jgi:hypothetical protein